MNHMIKEGLLGSGILSSSDSKVLVLSKEEHQRLTERTRAEKAQADSLQDLEDDGFEILNLDEEEEPITNSDKATAEETKVENKKAKKEENTGPSVLSWFGTFMCMSLPVIGAIYLLILCFGKVHPEKRNFARAWILARVLFFICSLTILCLVMYFGIDIADRLLDYMQQL